MGFTEHIRYISIDIPDHILKLHYNDVIMGMIASQITSLTIVYSTVDSGADQRKHQRPASLAFVRGIHREPVNSPHKWPVTRKNVSFWWRHYGFAELIKYKLTNIITSCPLDKHRFPQIRYQVFSSSVGSYRALNIICIIPYHYQLWFIIKDDNKYIACSKRVIFNTLVTIFQTAFPNGFSWLKMYEFRLTFHWSLFLGVKFKIFQNWFR